MVNTSKLKENSTSCSNFVKSSDVGENNISIQPVSPGKIFPHNFTSNHVGIDVPFAKCNLVAIGP